MVGHENCRAVYQKLAVYVGQLQAIVKAVNDEDKRSLLSIIQKQGEELKKKDDEICNLKLALEKAEFCIWNDKDITLDDQDKKEQAESKESTGEDMKSIEPSSLETDGCISIAPEMMPQRFNISPSIKKDTLKDENSMRRPCRVSEELNSQTSQGSFSTVCRLPDKEELQMKNEKQAIGGQFPRSSRSYSSRDVNDLLVQNIRMKKIVQDLLDVRGITIGDYLNKSEYEDVITQLRQELERSRIQVANLKQLLDNKDSENKLLNINKKNVEKIAKLERGIVVQRVLTEAYNDQYNKVKVQLTESQKKVQRIEEVLLSIEKAVKNYPDEKLPKEIKDVLLQKATVARTETASAVLPTDCRDQRLSALRQSSNAPTTILKTSRAGASKSGVLTSSEPQAFSNNNQQQNVSAQTASLICDRCDRSFDKQNELDKHKLRCSD